MNNRVREQKRAFAARQGRLLSKLARADYRRDRGTIESAVELTGVSGKFGSILLYPHLASMAKRKGRALAIAEVGSGDGKLSETLRSDLGANVTSVDPFPRRQGTVAGTFEALPLADGSQDVVLSVMTHNYTLDKLKAIQEAHRVLVYGGLAMIQVHPGMPLVFHSGGQRLAILTRDFVRFIRSRGHSARLINNSPSRLNSATLLIRKNKSALGMRFRWRGSRRAYLGTEGLLESSTWSGVNEWEQVPHYLTDRRTFSRLKQFAIPIRPIEPAGDGY